MPPIEPKKAKAAKKAASETVRELQYEAVTAEVFQGENALTVDGAKHLLGWEEEPEGEKLDEWFLLDENGKKVRLKNNVRNRWYDAALAEKYIQEHLQRRWKLNGESFIVGEYGETMDGQHRLISLVLAEQRRLKDLETDGHWAENWPGPVTMECVVVTGIKEDDDTANSINTGAPRTMAHVLYRSEHFRTLPSAVRKQVARSMDHAIRYHWHRTGRGMDAFAPRRTHSEAIAHLDLHPKLIKCLRHVVEKNSDDNRIGKFLPLGYAATLMYLMGSGKSSWEKYKLADPSSEKRLDWTLYKRAEEFFALLAEGEEFKEVRYAIGSLNGIDNERKVSLAEKVSVLIKAWRLFAEEGFAGFAEGDSRINLGPDSYKAKDDRRVLIDNPTCGGIDLGEPKDDVVIPTGDSNQGTEPEETPEMTEEVEAEKEAIVAENVETEAGKGVASLIEAGRKEWPGRLLAWKYKDHYRVWGKDAETVSKVTGMKKDPKLKADGLQYLRLNEADFPILMAAVVKAKNHVVIVKIGSGGKPELVDSDYDPDAKPAKKPNK